MYVSPSTYTGTICNKFACAVAKLLCAKNPPRNNKIAIVRPGAFLHQATNLHTTTQFIFFKPYIRLI
jgi:hypothetical protein